MAIVDLQFHPLCVNTLIKEVRKKRMKVINDNDSQRIESEKRKCEVRKKDEWEKERKGREEEVAAEKRSQQNFVKLLFLRFSLFERLPLLLSLCRNSRVVAC